MNNISYKKNLIFVIPLLLIILVLPNKFEALDYEITNYDINILVNENNRFNVTENINVYFYENEHVLYKKISYINSVVKLDGTKSNKYTNISKIKTNMQSDISYEDQFEVIQVTNPDVYVSGSENYEISYIYDIGRDTSKRYDELNYNIIINEWDSALSNITFKIEMPKEFDASKINFFTGYNNYEGYTIYDIDDNDITYEIIGNTITGSFNNSLRPHETLNIRIELPDKYFKTTFFDLGIWLPFLLPILFALISVFIWYKYGNDDKAVEEVQFYPPGIFNSAEIGFLYDGYASKKDIISLVLYLANKGYLEIIEIQEKKLFYKRKGFILRKLKNYDGNNGTELMLFNGLFVSRYERILSLERIHSKWKKSKNNVLNPNSNIEVTSKQLYKNFYLTINEISSYINNREHRERIFTKRSLKEIFPVTIMILISFMLITYAPIKEYYEDAKGVFIVVYIFAVLLPAFAFSAYMKVTFSKEKPKIPIIVWGRYFAIFVWAPLVLLPLIASSTYIQIYTSGLICIAIMIGASVEMPKRNEYGLEILGKTTGFKYFIKTVEKAKLQQLVLENPNYFYDILPYAYALGVSDIWIKKFENIPLVAPNWYTSSNASNSHSIGSSISSTMKTVKSVMTASPGVFNSGL